MIKIQVETWGPIHSNRLRLQLRHCYPMGITALHGAIYIEKKRKQSQTQMLTVNRP